jgi:hypothetical protein
LLTLAGAVANIALAYRVFRATARERRSNGPREGRE